MFFRQDTEENVLLRATEAAEKLIKVSSFRWRFMTHGKKS